jgi:hypothetical protein
MTTYYAVVEGPGMHDSGEYVSAEQICQTREAAERYATQRTRERRKAMAPYGGTSGYYRVVETTAANRQDFWKLGHDLDQL